MHATRYIHYIYIIGIAFLLQGCRRESHPSTPDTETYAISMSPSAVTRALFDNVADLRNTGFKVYGYKEDKAAFRQQIFTDQVVSYDGGWKYTPTRYWDRVANYCFAAYAPATLTNIAVANTTTGSQTLTFTLPQWQKLDGSETDLIVATSKGAATSYLDNGGVVDMAFNHVYAQLTVVVLRNAFLVKEYRLKTLAYKDMPANVQTTYTIDYTAGISEMNTQMLGEGTSVFMRPADTGQGDLIESTATDATRFSYLVVPSTNARPNGFRITLDYTIGGDPFSAEVNSGLTELKAGNSYVLRLNFDNGADIIPSVTIEEWVDENIDKDDDMHNW